MSNITIERKIDNILSPMVGQTAAKNKIKLWAAGGVVCGGYLESLLIHGPIGAGKTRLIQAIVEILKLTFPQKVGNICIFEKGSLLGSPISFADRYALEHLDDKDGATVIDELHETPKPTATYLRSMIQPDTMRRAVRLKHPTDDTKIMTIDPNKTCFVMATSETDKLDEALVSRVMQIPLAAYTDEEMEQILFNGANENEIIFHENSLRPLAEVFRGSARDVPKVLNQLIKLIRTRKKNSVNKQDVRDLMKVMDMYPQGLFKTEVKYLMSLEKMGNSQLKILASRNGILPKQAMVLERILFAKGFIEIRSTREITTLGRDYLNDLRKHNHIPA